MKPQRGFQQRFDCNPQVWLIFEQAIRSDGHASVEKLG